jgi:hypothetical protein
VPTCLDCLTERGIKIPDEEFISCPKFPEPEQSQKWRISMGLAKVQAVCDNRITDPFPEPRNDYVPTA